MNFAVLMLAVCIVLLLIALFFVLFAIASVAFPQSRTTVEVYPTDVRPPRRWSTILVQAALGLLAGSIGVVLVPTVVVPAWKVQDAEEIARQTFREKLGRVPQKLVFEDRDPRGLWEKCLDLESGWELHGAAWLDDNESWDLTVRRTASFEGSKLECSAQKRP